MHKITLLLLQKHEEASILERIDDAKTDYIDLEDCDNDFDGNIEDCYTETGRNQAEYQILNEILEPHKDTLDPDELTQVWEELCVEWELVID